MEENSPIYYKSHLQGEADRVQRMAIKKALEETDKCLSEYCSLEASHNGRYINSDLFKEIFSEFSMSKESRKEFDLSVHNSSAWLAQTLFEKKIEDSSVKGCIFLTGVPGAGKTIFIQSLFDEGKIPDGFIVFEGSICNVDKTREKMQMLKDKGIEIHVIIINANIELAVSNVMQRETDCGRGATAVSLAQIASRIKPSMLTLNEMFDISEIGLYTKLGDNNNVIIEEGIDAIKRLPDYSYDELLNYIKSLINQKEGMVL